jgi:hypothetical protein
VIVIVVASANASANELGVYVVLFRIVLASTPFNVQLDARGRRTPPATPPRRGV